MLELIILGRVPGTELQITFNWVLIATGVLLASYAVQIFIAAGPTPLKRLLQVFIRLYRLVRYSVRTVAILLTNTVGSHLSRLAYRVLPVGQKSVPSDS
ncbi:MAG: hypothetical protein JWL85_458 [Candidatus Saccharibacteria bacterium]|nr:hypothetical protein [Candidatus Saccharibacteria bacterium]